MPDFVGADANERREQEKAAAIKAMREIAHRLVDHEEVFGPMEFLTEVLPAIIIDQIERVFEPEDEVVILEHVVKATQKILVDLCKEDLPDLEGLGFAWKGGPRLIT